jgi:hypothetical protein
MQNALVLVKDCHYKKHYIDLTKGCTAVAWCCRGVAQVDVVHAACSTMGHPQVLCERIRLLVLLLFLDNAQPVLAAPLRNLVAWRELLSSLLGLLKPQDMQLLASAMDCESPWMRSWCSRAAKLALSANQRDLARRLTNAASDTGMLDAAHRAFDAEKTAVITLLQSKALSWRPSPLSIEVLEKDQKAADLAVKEKETLLAETAEVCTSLGREIYNSKQRDEGKSDDDEADDDNNDDNGDDDDDDEKGDEDNDDIAARAADVRARVLHRADPTYADAASQFKAVKLLRDGDRRDLSAAVENQTLATRRARLANGSSRFWTALIDANIPAPHAHSADVALSHWCECKALHVAVLREQCRECAPYFEHLSNKMAPTIALCVKTCEENSMLSAAYKSV